VQSSKLTLRGDLPFVTAEIRCLGKTLLLDGVLIDTGSCSTCFEADMLKPLGLLPGPDDVLQLVRGVGGVETVYPGVLDALIIDDFQVTHLPVDIGTMGYGFGINAILGMDFLIRTGAIIDLPARLLRFTSA